MSNTRSVQKSSAKKAKGPRGRKQEKIQISVRIDKAHMDLAYDFVKERELHITDVIERGIVYVLRNEKYETPQTRNMRFLIGEISPVQERKLRKYLRYIACTELSELERRTREFVEELVDLFDQDPRAERAEASFRTVPGSALTENVKE